MNNFMKNSIVIGFSCFLVGIAAGAFGVRVCCPYSFHIYTVTVPIKKSGIGDLETGGNQIDYVWRMNRYTGKVERGAIGGSWGAVGARDASQ